MLASHMAKLDKLAPPILAVPDSRGLPVVLAEPVYFCFYFFLKIVIQIVNIFLNDKITCGAGTRRNIVI